MARVIEQERDKNDALKYDNGAYVRDAMDALRLYGVCPESSWRYKTGDTVNEVERLREFAKVPTATRKKNATRFRVETARTDDVDMLLNSLAAGHPVVFGFMCHTGMWKTEVDRSGVVPMPGTADSEDGGHCICAVDYDLDFEHPSFRGFKGAVLAEGSWSEVYGDQSPWWPIERVGGFHILPLEYFRRKYADDAWSAIREAT